MLFQKHVMHTNFDIYVFIISGSPAYRNTKSGSWFLNAIVWTFKYHACDEDIHHLLTRVGLNISFFIKHFKTPKAFSFQLKRLCKNSFLNRISYRIETTNEHMP